MPARLRELSQEWGNLAVRGFDKSAQAEIDKNDRQRAQLQGIGNVVASGIVRKKGRERQDKLLAEERAREDKIRAERYGREDAREAKEDGRYIERKQNERDVLALKLTQDEMGRLTEEARNADPESQQAVMGRYAELKSRYDTLTGRLMGSAQQAATATGQQYAARFGTDPNDEDTPLTAQEQAAMTPGAPAARPTPAASMPAAVPATGKVPAPGMAAAPAAEPQADPTFLTPSGQKALEKSAEAREYGARYAALDKAAAEVLRRKDKAKTPGEAFQLEARYRSLLMESEKARTDAAKAGDMAKVYEAQGRREVESQAKKAENTAKVQQVVNLAKTKGPFVTGQLLRAMKEGVTDPAMLMSVVVGAQKPAKEENRTPAQQGADQAEKDAAVAAGRRAKNLDPATGNPLPTEEEWLADQSEAGMDRYRKQMVPYPGTIPAPRWGEFTDDEIVSVMNDKNVSPDVRAQFRAEFDKREGGRVAADAIRGVKVPDPFGGGAAAPAPKQRATAAAEFKSLPPEAQTPEAWAAIKRKHGL